MDTPNFRSCVAAKSDNKVAPATARQAKAVISPDRAGTSEAPLLGADAAVDGVSADHAGSIDVSTLCYLLPVVSASFFCRICLSDIFGFLVHVSSPIMNVTFSQADNTMSVLNPDQPRQAAGAFTIFKYLPYEIRIQIWRQSMDQNPRLIELEWTDKGNPVSGFIRNTHEWWQVCPRSRQLPIVMQVCRESMKEGKLYLEYRLFDSENDRLNSDMTYKVYFNPRADIVFFGESTCVTTMLNLFSETPGLPDVPIPRVAIMCDARGENCCNHGDPIYGVRGGVQIMHALHGFEKAVTKYGWRYGGCTGLEEVHFIVKSTLWQRGAGAIDWTLGLRPATMDVVNPVDLAVTQRLERQIAWVNNDYGIPRTGKFAWADKKPVFRFSSLAPVSASGNIHEGIILGAEDVRNLEEKDSKFVKTVGQRSGWSI